MNEARVIVSTSVAAYLDKYFELARCQFADGSPPLAAFFALTIIEECGKILYIRDANLVDKEERNRAIQHSEKYVTAVINLIDASERFDALPDKWRDKVWSWLSTDHLSRLRNASLYLRFDTRGRFTTPDEAISADDAALLVYLAAFVIAELQEYAAIDPAWADSIMQRAEAFRSEHLKDQGLS